MEGWLSTTKRAVRSEALLSGGYDILLKSSTVIGTSKRKIDMDSVKVNESQTITLSSITSKKQYNKVNVNIKVIKVGEPDE